MAERIVGRVIGVFTPEPDLGGDVPEPRETTARE
jgi:hypothetical protein